MGMLFFVFTVILRSVFLRVPSFSADAKNCTNTSFLSKKSNFELLISSIANVSAMEPPVEVSDKCQPADLTPIEKLNCSQHPGLSGIDYKIGLDLDSSLISIFLSDLYQLSWLIL